MLHRYNRRYHNPLFSAETCLQPFGQKLLDPPRMAICSPPLTKRAGVIKKHDSVQYSVYIPLQRDLFPYLQLQSYNMPLQPMQSRLRPLISKTFHGLYDDRLTLSKSYRSLSGDRMNDRELFPNIFHHTLGRYSDRREDTGSPYFITDTPLAVYTIH